MIGQPSQVCAASVSGAIGHSAGPSRLADILTEAESVLSDVTFAADSRERLGALAQRLAEQRLHVAVLGQFKRGKSTFLNALLGADLLPTAVVPVTSVPIFLEYGPAAAVRIHYRDNRPPEDHRSDRGDDIRACLFAVAAEDANPHNRLGVTRIEVFFPAPVLAGGTVLIDTPGIGSSHRHNTDTARSFLSECDASVVVLSADPPITEVELAYLAEMRAKVPRLHFVLNKIDYLTPEERDQAVGFLKRVLAEHTGEVSPAIHCLSARRALAAKLAGDAQAVEASGLTAIEKHVIDALAEEKAGLLEQAIAGKAAVALMLARSEVSLATAALRMPMDDLGRCLAAFEVLLPRFERQRREAQDLLAGDRKRLAATLEEEADGLRTNASNHLAQVIADALTADRAEAEAAARDAVAATIPTFFEDELTKVSRSFGERVTELFGPHQNRAAELIGSVRQAAAELFNIPFPASQEVNGLELSLEPYWVTRKLAVSMIPLPRGQLDFLLPQIRRDGASAAAPARRGHGPGPAQRRESALEHRPESGHHLPPLFGRSRPPTRANSRGNQRSYPFRLLPAAAGGRKNCRRPPADGGDRLDHRVPRGLAPTRWHRRAVLKSEDRLAGPCPCVFPGASNAFSADSSPSSGKRSPQPVSSDHGTRAVGQSFRSFCDTVVSATADK